MKSWTKDRSTNSLVLYFCFLTLNMLSERIKTLRKKKGMSQEKLALELHVVRQIISKWENALSVPDADELIHLANVPEVSVNSLLGVEEKESLKKEVIRTQVEFLPAKLLVKQIVRQVAKCSLELQGVEDG